jgi:hypothetical protein
MAAGAQHDTIDDHAEAWNWHKVTNLGLSCLDVLAVDCSAHHLDV